MRFPGQGKLTLRVTRKQGHASSGSAQVRGDWGNPAVTPLPPEELAGESTKAGTSDTQAAGCHQPPMVEAHCMQVLSPISLPKQHISS